MFNLETGIMGTIAIIAGIVLLRTLIISWNKKLVWHPDTGQKIKISTARGKYYFIFYCMLTILALIVGLICLFS